MGCVAAHDLVHVAFQAGPGIDRSMGAGSRLLSAGETLFATAWPLILASLRALIETHESDPAVRTRRAENDVNQCQQVHRQEVQTACVHYH